MKQTGLSLKLLRHKLAQNMGTKMKRLITNFAVLEPESSLRWHYNTIKSSMQKDQSLFSCRLLLTLYIRRQAIVCICRPYHPSQTSGLAVPWLLVSFSSTLKGGGNRLCRSDGTHLPNDIAPQCRWQTIKLACNNSATTRRNFVKLYLDFFFKYSIEQIQVSSKSDKIITHFTSTTCVHLPVSWYFAICEKITRNRVDLNWNNMSPRACDKHAK
jgi:hypothetical protein